MEPHVWSKEVTLADLQPGDTWLAWSERVFGVPCHFTVLKVGRKNVKGVMHYGGHAWNCVINPGKCFRLLEREGHRVPLNIAIGGERVNVIRAVRTDEPWSGNSENAYVVEWWETGKIGLAYASEVGMP